MKIYIIRAILILLIITFTQAQQNQKSKKQSAPPDSFPDSIECIVQPFYRHRPDGKAGREVTLNLKGSGFSGRGVIEMTCSGEKEILALDMKNSIDQYVVLLPPGAGVINDCTAEIVLQSAARMLSVSVPVPAKRQWTVYIYPHSHVDIGYTNTQENVEIIHRRNLIYGIELAKKTAGYPEDARYLWNPEVLWPVERYLAKATPAHLQMKSSLNSFVIAGRWKN
jgi:hypothetical protein